MRPTADSFAAAGHRRGFSLVEMLIVVSILGITSAMVAPKLHDLSAAADVRGARAALAVNVARARASAIQRGRATRVSVENSKLWTVVNPGAGETMLGDTVRLDSLFHVTATPRNAPAERRTLEFDGRGIGVLSGARVEISIVRDARHTGEFCVWPSGMIDRQGCGT